jgi:hypothetical protein
VNLLLPAGKLLDRGLFGVEGDRRGLRDRVRSTETTPGRRPSTCSMTAFSVA